MGYSLYPLYKKLHNEVPLRWNLSTNVTFRKTASGSLKSKLLFFMLKMVEHQKFHLVHPNPSEQKCTVYQKIKFNYKKRKILNQV